MSKAPKQVAEFLGKKHIAVAGVSRDLQQPANAIYRKLRGAGYQVYAINPNAERMVVIGQRRKRSDADSDRIAV